MYSNSSRTPCVPQIVSTHTTGHVWTSLVPCVIGRLPHATGLQPQKKQRGPIPSCGLKVLIDQNCPHMWVATWVSPGIHKKHSPCTHRPSQAQEWKCHQMGDTWHDGRRNVERLAWWEGRQKGEKEGKKKQQPLSPQVFVRVFSCCHQGIPPEGGCWGKSVRKWLMPAKLPRRSYFKKEKKKTISK